MAKNGVFRVVEQDIFKAVKAEIKGALDYLIWQDKSSFNELTRSSLGILSEHFNDNNSETEKKLSQAIISGRFDKNKFGLSDTLIMGEDGGLYLLLNRLNEEQKSVLVEKHIVTKSYLEDKFKKQEVNDPKGDKVILGKGGFGTVKFALNLLKSKASPGEIICIKKTEAFGKLESDEVFSTPLEQATEATIGDYFTNDIAETIYAPNVFDLALVTEGSAQGRHDHRKGYLMMEMLPQNTATKIFEEAKYQKWEYQKPYLLDVFNSGQEMLSKNIAMTDLKPDNTLYDTDTRKATIIDLGGTVKVEHQEQLSRFDIKQHSFQSTKEFRAPELGGSGVIDMHQALAYAGGMIMKEVTTDSGHKVISDYDEEALSNLVAELTNPEASKRISIPEAINRLNKMGDDSYKENAIFSQYIANIKNRIEHNRSSIGINRDIDKTKDLYISLNTTTLNPNKYKDLKTEELFTKMDSFLGSDKQVMALFGSAGSGKSIGLQLKFIEAINSWSAGKALPVYFNLAGGIDLDTVIRSLNTELGSNIQVDNQKNYHLYIDSFDEGLGIEKERETLVQSYIDKLNTNSKIIITCRTDYLTSDNDYSWFTPIDKKTQKPADNKLDTYYIAPINYSGHQGLPAMVDKYVTYRDERYQEQNQDKYTTKEYLEKIEGSKLKELLNTGFMFYMTMEVLFELKGNSISKQDIYKEYVNKYQDQEIAKLTEEQKGMAAKFTHFKDDEVGGNRLGEQLKELAKYLAVQLHLKDEYRLSNESELFKALGYEDYTSFKYQASGHILKLLPLKIETKHTGSKLNVQQEVSIGFIHDTIKNHYLLEAIKDEIKLNNGHSKILGSKTIVEDVELVRFIVDAARDDADLAKSLRKAIDATKQDKRELAVTYAANAITILVAAKQSFSGEDLSGISVKGASIRNGIFYDTNFTGADLSYVNMTNIKAVGAKFVGSNMKGIKLSILPDLLGHTEDVNSVSYSPDGKHLVSASRDKIIKIWDVVTGENISNLEGHTEGVNSVSYSPDGKHLLSHSYDHTIKIWEVSSGKCLSSLQKYINSFYCNSFSPDGKHLACAFTDNTIKISDVATGENLFTLEGHTSWFNIVRYSPDGKHLASASYDKTIKIWDVVTSKNISNLEGHTEGVNSVSYSPDGKHLVSASGDHTIKIWDAVTGKNVSNLQKSSGGFYTDIVEYYNNGKYVACLSDRKVRIRDAVTDKDLCTLDYHNTGHVVSVSISSDGKYAACLQKYYKVRLFNAKNGKFLNINVDAYGEVSFSPDGKHLASGLGSKEVEIWDFMNSKKLCALGKSLLSTQGHLKPVNSVSFSPNGKHVASGSDDYTVKVWNLKIGTLLRTLEGHTGYVNSVSYSPRRQAPGVRIR